MNEMTERLAVLFIGTFLLFGLLTVRLFVLTHRDPAVTAFEHGLHLEALQP